MCVFLEYYYDYFYYSYSNLDISIYTSLLFVHLEPAESQKKATTATEI